VPKQQEHQRYWRAVVGTLDQAAGIVLERITFGLYQRYGAGTQSMEATVARIGHQTQVVNKQISENFTVLYQQAVQDLNWINHVEQSYTDLTPADKASLQYQKEQILETLRANTATGNEELIRQLEDAF
jgi:hypothetical protein